MALTREQREQFLAEPHIAALAVDAGEGRAPLVLPIWYQYTPGGEPWIFTGAGSHKARLIEATGFFTLMVERLEPTVRYVAVDGAVSRIEPENLGAQVAIYMQPQHWLSSDLGSF